MTLTPTNPGGTPVQKLIRRLEFAGLVMACLCVCLIMLIVTSDALLRYTLSAPWPWTLDVISSYLLVGAAYLGISATFTMGDHINIDILQRRFSPVLRARIDALLTVLFMVVFGAIGFLALRESMDALKNNSYIPGYIPWPVWLSFAPIPAGIVIFVARMTHHTYMLLTHGSDPFVVSAHSEEIEK